MSYYRITQMLQLWLYNLACCKLCISFTCSHNEDKDEFQDNYWRLPSQDLWSDAAPARQNFCHTQKIEKSNQTSENSYYPESQASTSSFARGLWHVLYLCREDSSQNDESWIGTDEIRRICKQRIIELFCVLLFRTVLVRATTSFKESLFSICC